MIEPVEQRAAAHGVATWYEDSTHRRVDVPPETVEAVLDVLGAADESPTTANGGLPATIVLRPGDARSLPGPLTLTLEDGSTRVVDALADLPLGWHRLRQDDREITVVAVPDRAPAPAPAWGWMVQLYALRSRDSWGIGDFADLAAFATEAGRAGAGFIQLNPLHAPAPTLPMQASPYSPTSRRFLNPIYVRVENTDAYRAAGPAQRARIDALRPPAADPIDYDAISRAKYEALGILFSSRTADEPSDDVGLREFATYCAMAEAYGPDFRSWPSESPGDLGERVAYHVWLQQLCDRQFAAAAEAATASGMPIGLVVDLAVGVDPTGADAWTLAGVLAEGVRIGAPPDAFNQLGQDWGLAAWHPTRLAESGYAAYRDLLRRLLSRAGGLRIDHVAGLWRLWWALPGRPAADGTYVSYDADAMVGILALEAQRAGAVVIGEDLGTVPDAVTLGLRERGMLGCSVLWFTRDPAEKAAPFLPPDQWPRYAEASISTHDLPTAYGFLAGEHVRVRAALHQLTRPIEEERAQAVQDRELLLRMLVEAGLLEPVAADDPDAIVAAMHGALLASPSLLVAVSPYDVLGELRQPNLPGTVDQYPNWRLPLPVDREDLFSDPRVTRICAMMTAGRPRATRSDTA
jgi:4-alpha-glucanotransferase